MPRLWFACPPRGPPQFGGTFDTAPRWGDSASPAPHVCAISTPTPRPSPPCTFADLAPHPCCADEPRARAAHSWRHRTPAGVRGHQAYVARNSRDPQRGPTGATELAWVEADGLAISLRSHRYSVDELVSVADELEVTGGSAHLTDQESDRGLGPVYEVEDLAWSILGQQAARASVRSTTGQSPAPPGMCTSRSSPGPSATPRASTTC
jgi:hypothetical protein